MAFPSTFKATVIFDGRSGPGRSGIRLIYNLIVPLKIFTLSDLRDFTAAPEDASFIRAFLAYYLSTSL